MARTAATRVATELRARLLGRLVALARLGNVDYAMCEQHAWWCADSACLWFFGSRANLRRDGLATRRGTKEKEVRDYQEGVEALVLLGTLARVDHGTFMRVIREAWPRDANHFRTKKFPSSAERLEMGYCYEIGAPVDAAVLLERISSDDPPRASFVSDYAWLKTALSTLGDDGLSKLPARAIPLRLVIFPRWYGNAERLASVLGQLADHVRGRPSVELDDARAAVVVKFRLVEIILERTPVNADSLASLAELKQLGVRVPNLPSLHVEDLTARNYLTVTSALQTLFPPASVVSQQTAMQWQTKTVSISDRTTSWFLPAIFSAIHASRGVHTVIMEQLSDPTSAAARAMWRWAAYTLFSRHATPHVQSLIVDMRYVNEMIGEIEQVLHATNPLAALFETTYQDDDQWLSASRFFILDPSVHALDEDEDCFIVPARLCVRVVDDAKINHRKWWRVLLPGRGPAWVKDEDGTTEPARRDTRTSDGSCFPACLSHVRLDGMSLPYPARHLLPSMGDAMAFLRLLPRGLISIDIRPSMGMWQPDRERTDMNDFTAELLRVFPNLEQIRYTKVTRLSIYVEAAEAGYACLRAITLFNKFQPDDPELLGLLRELSDTDHPLTKQLEVLELVLRVLDDSLLTNFFPVWHHMLELNRKLHTIALVREASDLSDMDQGLAARPLDLASKLAFLSVCHNGTVRGQLDSSVLAMVFEFAAPHRVRKTRIYWR